MRIRKVIKETKQNKTVIQQFEAQHKRSRKEDSRPQRGHSLINRLIN